MSKKYTTDSITINDAPSAGTDGVNKTYADSLGGGGDVSTDAIWDAKGDLAVGTGADTASKLTVGTNDYVLTADSTEATGLKWNALPTGTISMSIFSARTTATTDTAGTNVDVTWNTEIKKDTGFTHSAASTDITFDFDGWVDITFAAGIDGATNRAETEASAYVDTGSGFAKITTDIAKNYTVRDATQDEGCVVLNMVLQVSNGDDIKFNMASIVDGGAANIDPTQTRVIIRRIDDLGEGIKGDTGATGPAGGGLTDVVDDTTPQLGGDLDANGNAMVAADHGTASTDQVVNVCYGTSATPPTASTTTEGALYVQYTA